MSRRIEIELTSARPDGSWTWRAAGAQKPKGVLSGSILPEGSKSGDVLKVETEMGIDGIDVTSVVSGGRVRKEPARLEILGSNKPFEAVLQTRAPGGSRDSDRRRGERGDSDRPRGPRPDGDRPRGPRPDGARGPRPDGARGPRPDGDRGPRPDGDRPRGPRPDGDRPRGPRPDGDSRPAGDRPRGPRPDGDRPRGPRPDGAPGGERRDWRERPQRPRFEPVPELPQRPKAKRLKPGRTHRNAVVATLSESDRAIAEKALLGGIPAVRTAVNEQNVALRAAGQPEIPAAGLLKIAEELLPRLRVAEWLDRADAAKADLDELDLKDLRSVVASGEDPMVARDETTRALAAELKEALATRQERALTEWQEDISMAVEVGRVIRALKLSSEPPKAGVRFPAELGQRLADATNAALTPDSLADRWSAVLEAAAFSPIRSQVAAAAAPSNITDDLRKTVTRLAPLLPQIAGLFGISVTDGASAPKPLRAPRRPDAPAKKSEARPGGPRPAPAPKPPVPSVVAAVSGPSAVVEATVVEAVEAPAMEALADGPVVEVVEAPVVEVVEATDVAGVEAVGSPVDPVVEVAQVVEAVEAPVVAVAEAASEVADTPAAVAEVAADSESSD